MDGPPTLADELPGLYRTILEIVGQLERTADRSKAVELRMRATEIYSRSWDDRAARRLTSLLARLHDLEAKHEVGGHAAPRWRLLDWPPLRRVALSR